MPEIVFDSCVLSNFALAKAIPVLERLYSRSAFVTNFVATEIMRGIQKGHAGLEGIKAALRDGRLTETVLKPGHEKDLFEKLSVSLGLGEASSIAVAKNRGWTFACDDRLARQETASIGVRLTGTIGILVRADGNGMIDRERTNRVLSRMSEKSGFLSWLDQMNTCLTSKQSEKA